MMSEETPQTTSFIDLTTFGKMFNATMSYRTDSTIYRPYGFIDKISRTSAKNKSTLPIPKMLHQGSDLAMPTGTRAPDWIKASIKQKVAVSKLSLITANSLQLCIIFYLSLTYFSDKRNSMDCISLPYQYAKGGLCNGASKTY